MAVLFVFAIYVTLPIFTAPISIEGFEAATTTYINRADVPMLSGEGYNFYNRPGEHLLYRLLHRLLQSDTLAIAAACSGIAYFISMFCVGYVGKACSIAGAYSATFAFLLLFDMAAGASQATSSNLSTACLAVAAAFAVAPERLSRVPIFAVLSVMFAGVSALFRLDLLFLFPALGFIVWSTDLSPRGFCKAALLVSMSYVVAYLLYGFVGLDMLRSLFSARDSVQLFQGWAIEQIRFTLFPLLLPMAIAGFIARAIQSKRSLPQVLVLYAGLFFPTITIVIIYSGQFASPRFLIPAMPFLAIASAPFIEWVIKRSTMSNLAMVAISVAGVIVVGGLWNARQLNYIFDGLRYHTATFATPAKVREEKDFLLKADGLLESFVTLDLDSESTVVVTSWRNYNQLERQLVLAGWDMMGSVRREVEGASVACTNYHTGQHVAAICLAEIGREAADEPSMARLIERMADYVGGVSVVTNQAIKTELMSINPQYSEIVALKYDEWDYLSLYILAPRQTTNMEGN